MDVLNETLDMLSLPDGLRREAMVGGFEAASRVDRELAMWTPPLGLVDDFVLSEKDTVEARAHDLLRNDDLIYAGVQLHKDNIVGSFTRLVAQPDLRILGLDAEWEKDFKAEVEAKFNTWAESPQAWCDASRAETLTGILRLVAGIYLLSGEVLATLEWMDDVRPYRTAVRLIELARLRTPAEFAHDERVRGGIRFTRSGVPQTFYIHDTISPRHALTRRSSGKGYVAVPYRTQWGRQRVIYLREQLRPEQSRGISQLASILKTTRTLGKFRAITLQNAIVGATFAATIESDLPAEAVFSALGSGNVPDAVLAYADRYLQAVAQYVSKSRSMAIDGVKIPHLYPGTKLNVKPVGQPGGVGQDFEVSLIRHIATALGVPYEALAKDYERVNYSSARAAMMEARKFIESRRRLVINRFASMVYRAWFEEAANLPPSRGGLETLRGRNVPNIYEGMNLDAYTRCTWIGAPQGHIDPLKEAQAEVLMIKYGLTSRADVLAKHGKDWRDVMRQIKEERQFEEELGLSFVENDNQMNAASGSPREIEDEDGRSAIDEQRGEFKEDAV